ncbi:SWIM zinc finger family protein [Streptomyces sp. NBC_00344]|uniref:SWIM zinc finger family protein n=1 Tax=Streptomyces sp. NBC_00344 TaxID=2975720 RepID=UPI002E1CF3B7
MSSWWGNAWVASLEALSLDTGRLERGRRYADGGRVAAVNVAPGRILSYVQGSRPRPYRAELRLRTLSDSDWDRFLDAAAAKPGHIAALLDKDMPHSLVEAAADAGVALLPAPGDLVPSCSCPDSGRPCKHAAALCYETAALLDSDPFVLLLMRGRSERELLDELARRNAALSAREQPAATRTPGVPARQALAQRFLPPLPAPLAVGPHPGQPPAYPSAPGAPDPVALDQLATDAAVRAHTLLTTGSDPVGDLTAWQDAVRLAASGPTAGLTATTRTLYRDLAAATGRNPTELARAVAAWRQGGKEGLAVLESPWDPPAGPFDRARPALAAAGLPRFQPWRNQLTVPGGAHQLRFGKDHQWYAYESDPGRDDWWPRGTPHTDPVEALRGHSSGDGAHPR